MQISWSVIPHDFIDLSLLSFAFPVAMRPIAFEQYQRTFRWRFFILSLGTNAYADVLRLRVYFVVRFPHIYTLLGLLFRSSLVNAIPIASSQVSTAGPDVITKNVSLFFTGKSRVPAALIT